MTLEFPELGLMWSLASTTIVQLLAGTSTSIWSYVAPLGANHGCEGRCVLQRLKDWVKGPNSGKHRGQG